MEASHRVGVLIGSLRVDSYNRKMARSLFQLLPPSMDLEIIEIDKLPMYNQDLDIHPPQEWLDFREKIKFYDAFLFVTPEYNRSVSAVLKNAIDIGSRPYGENLWTGKPAAVISVSIGSVGGFGANHHLRQSLVYLNMPTMQQPEAYIGEAAKLFDKKGLLSEYKTRQFMSDFMRAFARWIDLTADRPKWKPTESPEADLSSQKGPGQPSYDRFFR